MRLQTICGLVVGAVMLAVLVVGSAMASTQHTLAAPTITGFAPKVGEAGTKVVITGTGLTNAKVAFFGVLAPAVAVNTPGTSITATVPDPGGDVVPEPGPITLTTPGGNATSSANFNYQSPGVHKVHPAGGKYYTYKAQVTLRAGQTLHFTSGKGYYAA